MKALVFGRNGQLARSLIECGTGFNDVDFIAVGRPEVNLERSGDAAAAIAGIRPDVVINSAAYTSVDQAEDDPERAFRVNAQAAGEIAQTSARIGARLLHVSTDYVFDGNQQDPYIEEDRANPLNVYGRSKLAGEGEVREVGGEHLIIRTSWVYGPFGRNFVRTMMAAADTRDSVDVVDDQWGSPTSSLDLAAALLKLCEDWKGSSRTYHLSGAGITSWCAFARQVMEERAKLGLRAPEVRPILTKDWPTRARRPMNSALNCSAIAADLGVRLPDWQHSVQDVVRTIARSHAL